MNPLAEHSGLRLVIGNSSHLAWAGEKLGVGKWPDDARALAIEGSDGARCVVVYNWFTDNSCYAHVATNGERNFATRGMLYGLFAFPFIHCEHRRITFTIAERDVQTQVLAKRLGFRFEGVMRDAIPGDNHVVMGMTRDECIWIKEH